MIKIGKGYFIEKTFMYSFFYGIIYFNAILIIASLGETLYVL